jgi:flagellum-specific peptidoglycan hydrolase FlgJ
VNAQQYEFLKLVAPAAQQAQRRWDVPASVTIAQAILESSNPAGWGQSQLARGAKNYFGIKATNLKDPETYIELPTHEYLQNHLDLVEAKFERYTSLDDSFDAHARLIANAHRYIPAMAAAKDPELFAMRLQQCGYSTNPSYGVILAKIMHDYDLMQFDVPPAPPANAQEVAA